jgi:diguanylate cyclase (GGDEF)-like protein
MNNQMPAEREHSGKFRTLSAPDTSGPGDSAATAVPIRILLLEENAEHAELVFQHLRTQGIRFVSHCVDTEPAMREALSTFQPNVVLSDFGLPRFDGLSALNVALELAADVPFIFVSGTIGEEQAIEALRRGAVDYVMKTNLSRLGPAVTRALAEAAARRQIARLSRVLRMLSGINGAVVRIRERPELFSEACRLAVAVGGYAMAMVLLKKPGRRRIEPIAWSDAGGRGAALIRNSIVESAARENSTINTLLRTGAPFVCNDTDHLPAEQDMKRILGEAGLRSLVAIPLTIDHTTVGILILAALPAGALSDEELQMLREVAANLSFALRYLQKARTVRFLSHFNPHTGLARRALFCERVARLLASGHRLAVAVVDIEQLSVINDSFGRHTGDGLLQHVAERLRRHFHDTERLAQFSGGTFAVSVDVDGDLTGIMSTLHAHLAAVFGRPFELADQPIPVSAKSGVALHPEDGQDANALVQNAEAALRNARTTGQKQLSYSARQHVQDKARLALEHRLRVALERRQFELYYQPKVSVKTRRLEGVEALIRWNEPDTGIVSPGAFLPLLESTGLIVDVGEWVFEQAVRDCQHWQQHGLPSVRIAVNVSPVQLRHQDFVRRFFDICASLAQIGCGLDIEITEGLLQANSAAEVGKLKSLRETGVRIAIDDFGTGHSSLSRLAELPIDILKIDRTFTSRLASSGSGRSVVRTILALARSFELTVVAEGVETQEELRVLTQLGCDQVQGFLLAKPMRRDELTAVLEKGQGRLILPAERGPIPRN